MNARDRGLRRIRLLSWGMAVVAAAGSVGFAGLARAATEPATSAPQPTPAPTNSTTKPGQPTKPGKAPSPTKRQPAPTHTEEPPVIISGGS